MNSTESLIEIFKSFLQSEPTILNEIQQCNFTTTPYSWHFTLPTLHKFLQTRPGCFYNIQYHQFRKNILNSPINEQLKPLSAKIIIIDNHYKVDLTIYALSRTTEN
jgi:hypothetical protein